MPQLLTIAELAKTLAGSASAIRKSNQFKSDKKKKADNIKFMISRINYDILRGRLPTQKKTITKEVIVLDVEKAKKFYEIA